MDSHALQPQNNHSTTRKKTGRRTKIIGIVLTLLALSGLGWLAWHLTHPDKASDTRFVGGRRGAPATTVGVATAERADIPVYLEALGTVRPASTAIVRPQVSGVLQKILFREGETVKAGQVLATIDPRQFELALMQASGQLQRDQAQLDNAKLVLQRYRTLLEQDSIARQEVDTQATLVKQLEGTVQSDRAAEGTARLNLGYSRIVAPISGRVGLRVVDVGNVVNANDANGIVVITQVMPIDVEFAVPQDQVPEVNARAGAAALPVTALDRTRVATLDTGSFLTLDNVVDSQTGTVRAKARFANAKSSLFPSQFVNVRLLLRTIQGGVMIPVTALRHGSGGDYVYVLSAEGTASLRNVTRGQATVDKVEITAGLKVGEKVITEGADRLKDGAKVTLPSDKPASGANGKKGQRGQRGQRPETSAATAPSAASASATEGRLAASLSAASSNDAAASAAASAQVTATSNAINSAVIPPNAEQRQKMLDQVKGNPEALQRRKQFLEQIDRGDPAALERWRELMERRRAGAQ